MAHIQYDLDILKDPSVFAAGRLDPCSDHSFFRCAADAELERSTLHTLLNGAWKFFYSENLRSLPDGFWRDDCNHSGWPEIQVPGHLQLQGYDVPRYTDVFYPWDGYEPLAYGEVPEEHNPTGSYYRTFELPEGEPGDRIVLTFEGVEAAFFCWVNGQIVGYSEDIFTPARFDITELVHPGTNSVAVQVYHYATCSWLEDQDFWRFSGIFRSVVLTRVPKNHVRDVFVHTDLNESLTEAVLRAELQLQLAGPTTLCAELVSRDGEVLHREERAASESMCLAFGVHSPRLWSAEAPNLYRLRLTLTDECGAVCEVAQTDVGFRRFEMKDGLMCLNGKRIVFHGANRHEFCAERGRCITESEMLRDVLACKRNNINAIRTSHYPNQSAWYRLCDRYGLYLIDEANIESHGTWCGYQGTHPVDALPGNHMEWLPLALDRARSMQERDKNHPSVLIWSCGNESGGGRVLYEMSEYMRRRDPSRLVHYEGVADDRSFNDTSDMESRMYRPVGEIRKWLAEHDDKPYILCEYAHAMGNSCGALHKYIELEDELPRYQGGFIWDFIDQGIRVQTAQGRTRLAYGGDFGDRPSDRQFCGNGLFFADRTESPKLQEVKYLYQPIRLYPSRTGVTLDNRQLFADTSEYDLTWKLLRNGLPIAEGRFPAPVVQAGEQAHCAIDLPEFCGDGEYVLHCALCYRDAREWADTDYELMHGESIIEGKWTAAPAEGEAQILPCQNTLALHDAECHAILSLKEANLVSLTGADGVQRLTTAPALSLYRAPTDNDYGCGGDAASAFWLGVCKAARLRLTRVDPQSGSLSARWELPFTNGAQVELRYHSAGANRLCVTMAYRGVAGLPDLDTFGLSLRLPADYHVFRYYGLGPRENYADRRHGAALGLYATTAGENLTPYLFPQECGNREGVRFCEVLNADEHGLRIESAGAPLSVSVLHYSADELREALHPDELTTPPCYTYLNIASRRMGVGGDNSWGAKVHPEYHIPSDGALTLEFYITVL